MFDPKNDLDNQADYIEILSTFNNIDFIDFTTSREVTPKRKYEEPTSYTTM